MSNKQFKETIKRTEIVVGEISVLIMIFAITIMGLAFL